MTGNQEYSTYYDGKWTKVHKLEDCLSSIKCRIEDNEKQIKRLEEENKQLKSENYKDEELSKMQSELEEMRADFYRGFPISEKEQKSIEEWQRKHEEEAHKLKTLGERLKAEGCIGGRYKYVFIPTSIGVYGEVACSCGARFEFQEIG